MNKTINQLMETVTELCEKEGISFYAKFKPTLDENEESLYNNGGFVFGASDIFNMIQHWEAKHKEKLFNENTYNITINTHDRKDDSPNKIAKSLVEGIKNLGESTKESGLKIGESLKEVSKTQKQSLADYVLKELTLKILLETIKEPELKIYEELGTLARDIVETKEESYKQMLINRYEKLKKIDRLEINNLTINDLDYKIKRIFDEKIKRTVGTIIHPENNK